MRTQTATLFSVPCKRRGTTLNVCLLYGVFRFLYIKQVFYRRRRNLRFQIWSFLGFAYINGLPLQKHKLGTVGGGHCNANNGWWSNPGPLAWEASALLYCMYDFSIAFCDWRGRCGSGSPCRKHRMCMLLTMCDDADVCGCIFPESMPALLLLFLSYFPHQIIQTI